MKLLALYWSFMIIAYVLAKRLKKRDYDFSWTPKAMMIVVYLLCLDMGLRMGINEEVTSSLGSIGVTSLIVTICCAGGSIGAITLTRKIFRMDRHGDLIGEGAAETGTRHEVTWEEKLKNLKTTIIIIIVVGGGMAIGALVIAGMFSDYLEAFDRISYYALVITLCFLMFFVGFDIGSKEGVFESIKTVGLRVLAFPIAAMIGTMIIGTASCIVMGFSMRESLAICAGFGWYSYAPIVIASAGQQYIIASAVSFMHNVMREVAGIILIPLIARKFGYIESTGLPGSAAMDVCIPIVEQSCRPDTVIYSFITGFMMCIATSVGVPLIMGV